MVLIIRDVEETMTKLLRVFVEEKANVFHDTLELEPQLDYYTA